MTVQQIRQLFGQRYHQAAWKQFLGETFRADIPTNPEKLLDINQDIAVEALRLGTLTLNENGAERSIAVYDVTLAEGVVLERNRVGLRNLLRKYWRGVDGAFITYHKPESPRWRFSYVSELTGFDAEGEQFLTKTEPKRFTYVLGEGESVRTAAERFAQLAQKRTTATLDDVKEAFSVEKLSDEFFDKYKDHYQNFVQFLTGTRLVKRGNKWEEQTVGSPNTQFASVFNGNAKDVRDFCKKLLGRIVFLYFLQKKGWLGAPVQGSWQDGDRNFLHNLFNEAEHKGIFYSEYLAKLFFDTLNKRRDGDLVELLPGKPCKIPYLNGGLFEEDNPKYRGLVFQQELFRNLFAFFDEYNFTIYEDDPDDQTVAVDPEMLGHIFENLLEDNKDKGAYYTPKEIVHYMCRESLIEYLATYFERKGYTITTAPTNDFAPNPEQSALFSLNEARKGQMMFEPEPAPAPVKTAAANANEIDRTIIEKLLKKQLDDTDKQAVLRHAAEFHDALDAVKICDPAIGSGAFPMGLLQEIFAAKQMLWLFEHGSTTTFPASDVKLGIIQNSIYGVDIEKGAVDIARLRFWLSLVVDEQEPKPLPNLDYKIVVGNSLVSKLGEEIIDIDWSTDTTKNGLYGAGFIAERTRILNAIGKEQQDFFAPDSNKKALAEDIRRLKIDLLVNQLRFMVATKGRESKPTDTGRNATQQTAHYLQTLGWKQHIKTLERLKEKPHEPLHFFDWKLDFPEVMNPDVAQTVGFDIVIGNPPYMRIQGIRQVDSNFADKIGKWFQSATGSFDLYVLFTEKGLKLAKADGILNFIMPIKWINSAFGKGLRQVIQDQKAANKIISFEAFQVFNASTYTGLQWFKRESNTLNYLQLDRDLPNTVELGNYLNRLSQNDFNLYDQHSLHKKAWTLTDNHAEKILQKIKQQPLKAQNIFEKIFTGLQTSKDSVYFIMNAQSDGKTIVGYSRELDKQVTLELALVKPLLKGDQVHRYEKLSTNNYVIFPYKLENGNAILYTETEIKQLFPKGYAYLKENEESLRYRENGRFNNDTWYQFGRSQGILFEGKPKLICPDICLGGNYTFDDKGKFYSTTTLYGYIKHEKINLSYEFLIGLFNSNLVWYFLQNTGTILANNYFRFMPRYVNEVPICKPNKNQEQKIVSIVNQIISQKTKGVDTTDLEQQIDTLVYKLYNLSYEEVLVIEPEFSLSAAEYASVEV